MSETLLTTLVTVIGGIIVAFISVRVRRSKAKPEYIDTAVAIYEATIKRQDEIIARQDTTIAAQEVEIKRLNEENEKIRRKK